ncbi:MAG: hypothetical protein HOW73_48315 [Polyangiaceae bacterium]|nr:hypothetical protein [Polyangiaceae bacterium]
MDFTVDKAHIEIVVQENPDTEVSIVREIRLGKTEVYPFNCVDVSTGLCAKEHARLLEALKENGTLVLAATKRTATTADLLFMDEGGGHCTATSYWMLRIEKRGAFATAPLIGCFWEPGASPARAPDQPDELPTWPLRIRPAAAGFGDPAVSHSICEPCAGSNRFPVLEPVAVSGTAAMTLVGTAQFSAVSPSQHSAWLAPYIGQPRVTHAA